ncbi:Oxidoreductase, short-chain dehydrogenase/reductase family [Olavius sp. associated proteobacterium Delta 1]|nr:Oxidoreductase, short-chain dehydrogenase/reductase family [Olavius sp. associated proteobacterium Delta 1]
MNKFRLDNKIALVTGGSKGIGFGIATALAEAGADLVLVARDKKTLDEAREMLSATGRRVWIHSFDMSGSEKISDLFAEIANDTGGVDILVNNAGGTRRGPAETLTAEDWQFVINLNMTATFTLCQAFARERIKNGKSGKIINIASLMSETVREDNAPYAASKGGIRQLTKALAVDWAKHAINVNAIGPGFIQTDLTKPLWKDDSFNKWVTWKTPWARWGKPEDLGNAAVYLAAPASDFVTGHILYVDGGLLSTFGPSSW